jgi:hypothetical protein
MANSLPTQGRPSISDLMTKSYVTDPLPGKILEPIRKNGTLKDITVAECTELDGRIQYRTKCYLTEDDQLQLQLIQKHPDTALAGHPGRVKMFDLLNRQYYWNDMQKQVDQYVRSCHSFQRSGSS